jgi:hypothetical protein
VRNAEALLAQAHGAPLRALALAEPGYQSERATWLAALATPRTLSPLTLSARIDAAPRDERKLRLAGRHRLAPGVVGRPRERRFGRTTCIQRRFRDRIGALGPLGGTHPLFRYHRALLEQRTLVSHPLQPRLVRRRC